VGRQDIAHGPCHFSAQQSVSRGLFEGSNSNGIFGKNRPMKKLKHEAELFKAGLLAAMKYAQERGAVEFEPTDSASQKLLYVYRLLVHDKMIQPLPEDQVAESTMRHKLAIWYSKQLPADHPLLK
jgi:hypothetical protein